MRNPHWSPQIIYGFPATGYISQSIAYQLAYPAPDDAMGDIDGLFLSPLKESVLEAVRGGAIAFAEEADSQLANAGARTDSPQ